MDSLSNLNDNSNLSDYIWIQNQIWMIIQIWVNLFESQCSKDLNSILESIYKKFQVWNLNRFKFGRSVWSKHTSNNHEHHLNQFTKKFKRFGLVIWILGSNGVWTQFEFIWILEVKLQSKSSLAFWNTKKKNAKVWSIV